MVLLYPSSAKATACPLTGPATRAKNLVRGRQSNVTSSSPSSSSSSSCQNNAHRVQGVGCFKNGMFSIQSRVKDPELDQFAVVNNSVYSVYLEDCRSEAFYALGFSVYEVGRQGNALALAELHMSFRRPLRSRDVFAVNMWVEKVTGARLVLGQDVRLLQTGDLVLSAEAVIVWLDSQYRPVRVPPAERTAFTRLYEQRQHECNKERQNRYQQA